MFLTFELLRFSDIAVEVQAVLHIICHHMWLLSSSQSEPNRTHSKDTLSSLTKLQIQGSGCEVSSWVSFSNHTNSTHVLSEWKSTRLNSQIEPDFAPFYVQEQEKDQIKEENILNWLPNILVIVIQHIHPNRNLCHTLYTQPSLSLTMKSHGTVCITDLCSVAFGKNRETHACKNTHPYKHTYVHAHIDTYTSHRENKINTQTWGLFNHHGYTDGPQRQTNQHWALKSQTHTDKNEAHACWMLF